jgi:hypothetical protein
MIKITAIRILPLIVLKIRSHPRLLHIVRLSLADDPFDRRYVNMMQGVVSGTDRKIKSNFGVNQPVDLRRTLTSFVHCTLQMHPRHGR